MTLSKTDLLFLQPTGGDAWTVNLSLAFKCASNYSAAPGFLLNKKMQNNYENPTHGASAGRLAVAPRNGERSISSADIFMQMRAARTIGVFRGMDLEAQKYGHMSKTINPEFESNLPTQLVINPIDIYPNDFSRSLATTVQLTFPFCDDIYEVSRLDKASKNICKPVTVCHKVFSVKQIPTSNMTLLNIGGYYPNQLLTVVIKGNDRGKFIDAPENYYKGKKIFVKGTVVDYKGKTQIVVSDPKQIQTFNN
jgi:hypothetical protein